MIVPPDRCVMAAYHHLMEDCGHCAYEFAPPSPEREEPKYTESDMRVLTEAALRLGRKEMFDHLDVAFDRITYASDDGLEFEHAHPADEGEPECPACWAQHIRQIFAEFSPRAAPDATSGRTDPNSTSAMLKSLEGGNG